MPIRSGPPLLSHLAADADEVHNTPSEDGTKCSCKKTPIFLLPRTLSIVAMPATIPFANPFDTVLFVAAFSTALLLGFAWILCTNGDKCRNVSKFMWSCFVKPFGRNDGGWGGALEGFYADQADVYDATRKGLLKGRTTMMKLAAAHLRAGLKAHEKSNLVWIDVKNCSPIPR